MTVQRPHPADRLLDAIDAVGAPVCVGIDPVLTKLPGELAGSPVAAIEAFSLGIVAAVRGIVPCVKFQSACYERFGPDGLRVLEQSMAAATDAGLITILDAKRGDIGISAEHYEAALVGHYGADWTTASPYLGMDCVAPLLVRAGAFALVRTSNPGSDALQSLPTRDGPTIAELVADLVAREGASRIGSRGYSSLGAVVGATKSREAAALRRRMPQQIFLVPGYGAQGGSLADVIPCFNADGRGAIITASRSVIYPEGSGEPWMTLVSRAAARFAQEISIGVAPSAIDGHAAS
ncbi:MAG: orotidine-5'-phosphate decarboxylase [Phycisphaerales bacterium]|nr:orotidine-5'-phosphate decarboxylase [Phycisphaerales bacterium]